jgi:DNA-binding transcriptional MerR regulator
LARIAEVSVRRLRYYVQLDLIEPSEFRGTSTRYQRRELLRLLGVLRMQSAARLSLAEIKRKLQLLSEPELEAWLVSQPLPPTAAAALGLSLSDAVAVRSPDDPTHAGSVSAAGSLGQGGSTWQRIQLLPGLELMLCADASPAVRRAARSICDEYLGAASAARAQPA